MKKVKILITYYKNEAQAFALGLFLCSYCNDKDKSGDICNDGNDRAFYLIVIGDSRLQLKSAT